MESTTQGRLRRLRDKSGKTLEQIAAYVGVSWRTILRWEEPDFEPEEKLKIGDLERLAEILDVSTDEILGRDR